MPKEDRRIIFNNEEVYKAIFAMCTQKQMKKPPVAAVTKIMESPENASLVVFELSAPQNAEEQDARIEYNSDFVAAALMLYCRGLGIPLPKSARKSVMIKDGVVTLRAKIG